MEGDGRSSFQPPSTGDRAAHVVHYRSGVYTRILGMMFARRVARRRTVEPCEFPLVQVVNEP